MTVRVGFLGAGLIASAHLVSLAVSGADYALAGVFDPDRARAERFTGGKGFVAGSEAEVLDSCDAVYVCTWTSEHRRLVEAACERGLAVLCEKPLSTDLAGARAMVDAVEQAGVVNQVGLVLRHSPAFGMLRAIAADRRRHGRPMAVVFRDDQYLPTQGMYGSTWRGDRERAGSGVLLEHSIHDLDLLERLMGPVRSVSAATSDLHGIDGIEDGAVVTLRFAGGAIGSLVTVWHEVLERPSQRRVELFTERCHAVLEGDWFGPVTWQVTGSAPVTLEGADLEAEAARRGQPVGNPDAGFVAAVAAGTPAWPTFADALRAHVLADAVYRSAAAGAEVEVPEP